MQPETGPKPALRPTGSPIEAVTAGRERTTSQGVHFLVESALPDPTEAAATWDELLHLMLSDSPGAGSRPAAGDILFLDTETTGLDRAVGTHVFLVGLGYFAGDQFRVEQHFLRDLHEEPSMLSDLSQFIRQFKVLITFNGRGFDWPMLTTRFIMNGYRELPVLAHWDLLHSSRRLWRNRLRDCSLGSLERQILGVNRIDDVPGSMIPDLYFDYLRTRDARPLAPVFKHNHVDIVSLAKLAERLLFTADDPHAWIDHPIDQVSYGVFLIKQGRVEPAIELIHPNLDSPVLSEGLRFQAYALLIDQFKRRRRWNDAVDLCIRMTRYSWSAPEQKIYPLVELAKHAEHREHDFSRAIVFVERAVRLTDLNGWNGSVRDELIHRYARLQRRLDRARARRQRVAGDMGD
jgi:uncharacterized protein